MISLRDVVREFDHRKVRALDHISLDLRESEFAVLRGPSGCGKSTLLAILGAMDRPDSGKVLYQGRACETAEDRRMIRSSLVGFIFQSFHLLPTLNALENVQVPMVESPMGRRDRIERAAHLLDQVGLSHRRRHLPSELSGGERQRVAIARALANSPKVILADEPTGNLDSANAAAVLDLLQELHLTRGTTLLVATHDERIAARGDRRVEMIDGRIREE